MILACSVGMFPPTKTSTCKEEGESKYNPTEAELVQRLVQVWWEMGRGGYGMAGGCNVVMLFVASHSSKGGRYGKGHIPPISSSLGWMLQQVPLKALCYYVLCLCMLFRGEIHFTEPMAWDMICTRTKMAPFHHSKDCPCKDWVVVVIAPHVSAT